MPPEYADLTPYIAAILVAMVTGLFSWRGGVRSAKSTEKVSLDDLTTEIIKEYQNMKKELKADLESRIEHEREERLNMKLELDRKFEEVFFNSKGLQDYVIWCIGGHKPPPLDVPHQALSELAKLYTKETNK